MRRYFNTEAQCVPDEHYMVRLDERLAEIKERYVDRGKYFVINRGRQYGKTTTLYALTEYLQDEYIVFSMDFQGLTETEYQNAQTFSMAFAKLLIKAARNVGVDDHSEWLKPILHFMQPDGEHTMPELFEQISRMCADSPKPTVLIIDEVDSAGNNQLFIEFLALLRQYYIGRRNTPIFQSVILAGVYDIKNLKLKIRPEEEHQYNSPWNIAAKFSAKMEFSAEQIAAMLREYETDNHSGMDIPAVAEEIYRYTSGYPYLVSAVCKILDEELPYMERFSDGKPVWGMEGISEAVKLLLKERNIPLFDSMVKQLDIYPDLRELIEKIIYRGERVPYSPDVKSINLGMMFCFLKEDNGQVVIANRIFEMRLLNMFLTEEKESEAYLIGERDHNQFIKNGRLDMELVLSRFVAHYSDIYGDNDESFIEKYGRKFFLLYLKPIINGVGNYYLEAQTRDMRRTDVVVDYMGEQYVVELKIWHGNEYNERGEEQLSGYLDYFHQSKGYMLSFNFNKNKQPGMKTIELGNRTIVEAVV